MTLPTGSWEPGVTLVSGDPVMRQSMAQFTFVLTKGTHTLITAALALVTLEIPARAPALQPPVNRTSRSLSAATKALQLNAVNVTVSPLIALGWISAWGRAPTSSEGGGSKGTACNFQQSSA